MKLQPHQYLLLKNYKGTMLKANFCLTKYNIKLYNFILLVKLNKHDNYLK